jgi:hydrogenase-4 component F
LLLFFGLLSMGVAAIFIVGQADYKRMLAYSSVEHMGILAVGAGLGGAGAFGTALHAINHSLTKAMLFLVAGNILATFGTKAIRDVRGVLRVVPWSGVLWLAGFLAITGTPPFGVFISEFTILKAALDLNRGWVAGIYLVLLAIIFVGMAGSVLVMTQGPVTGPVRPSPRREGWWSVMPPLVLCLLVLTLGLYIPPRLSRVLDESGQIISATAATTAVAPPPATLVEQGRSVR